MNPIAQLALERARASISTKPAVSIQAAQPLPQLVISGPINYVMEREGRAFALDVVKSLGSSIRNPLVVANTIRNLTMTATAQPSSYASGIRQVIDLLKEVS